MKRLSWQLTCSILVFWLAAFPVEVHAAVINPQKASSPSGPDDLAFQNLWIYKTNNATKINLVIDASGVLHAGFTAYSSVSGNWPAYYAMCKANCASESGWSTVAVGDVGGLGGDVRVAVTSAGHPSLMWFYEPFGSLSGSYYYAECSSSCGTGGTWTSVKLNTTLLSPENSRYFTLNKNGVPRFVFKDTRPGDSTHNNIYYAFCNTACTTGTNWSRLLIDTTFEPLNFSLALDPSGGAHLAFQDASGSSPRLIYQECPANCTSTVWNAPISIDLPTGTGMTFAMALNPQGLPRLAFYFGFVGTGNSKNDLLYYLWCDSACSGAGWNGYYLGLPAGYGETVDLAVDAQGFPRLAYYVDAIASSTYGLGYAACTANCETASAAWQEQMIDSTNDLDISDPVLPTGSCTTSLWLYVGEYPSMVLDASGNPYIGYDAAHYQDGNCTIHSDMNLVRVATSGNGPAPSQNWIYVPVVTKH